MAVFGSIIIEYGPTARTSLLEVVTQRNFFAYSKTISVGNILCAANNPRSDFLPGVNLIYQMQFFPLYVSETDI